VTPPSLIEFNSMQKMIKHKNEKDIKQKRKNVEEKNV